MRRYTGSSIPSIEPRTDGQAILARQRRADQGVRVAGAAKALPEASVRSWIRGSRSGSIPRR